MLTKNDQDSCCRPGYPIKSLSLLCFSCGNTADEDLGGQVLTSVTQ